MCGEKYPVMDDAFIDMGSPPRMRGKVRISQRDKFFSGITPAYAGKSCSVAGADFGRWDHPRVCGEKDSLHLVAGAEKGSPPRMRGKGLRNLVEMRFVRITPAYAGKRPSHTSGGIRG